MPKASIIIAFYNRIDFLQLILAGFERQTFMDFEIVIADDGSSEESVSELKKIIKGSPLNIKHVWHEDRGFRKNKIMNKALLESSTDYLIFIDGDCIPHKEFVREHFENKGKGLCLTGRRVNLSEKISSKLTSEIIKKGYLEKNFFTFLFSGISGHSNYIEKGIYIKSKILRELLNKKNRGLLGCNFSIHKNDLLSINGFDERYEGPAIGEDSDIQFRLELSNIKIKSLANTAIQFHLYHKIQTRSETNLELFKEVQKSRISYTPFGINKLNNSKV